MAPSEKELCVLVLQGGGALGSYQAGVFEVLHEKKFTQHWVAGTSIGAINAALIAGNPWERRVPALHEFWNLVTSGAQSFAWWPNDQAHAWYNEIAATWNTLAGAKGFFQQFFPPRILYPASVPGPISYYDASPLRATLERLVDFDLINRKVTRLSVGAVDVETGNLIYFDNHEREIRPEHIMASGALPPGFLPVEIDGRFYWDGGLVSNTPLQWVLDCATDEAIAVVQIDLFPARGRLPRTLSEVAEREKDIRYSSRTRLNTDQQVAIHRTKAAYRRLAKKLPPELKDDPDVQFLADASREATISILQMIYRSRSYEGGAKDFQFSRATMLEHWLAGAGDAQRSLDHPDWVNRSRHRQGISVFDLTRDYEQGSRPKGGTT